MPKTKKKESNGFNTKRVLSLVVIFLSTFGITASFAQLSYSVQNRTSYVVKGKENKNVFDLKLANMSAAELIGNSKVISDAKINNGLTSFEVQLSKPGDAVKYTLEIQNKGNVDGKIASMSKGNPSCTAVSENDTRSEEQKNADATLVCGNLEYTLTYENGTSVAANDVIKAGETKKVTVSLGYKANGQPATDSVKVTVPSLAITLSE